MEYLNEVKASLESAIDTKMSKMESQLETLTTLLNSVVNKGIPTVEVEDPSLAIANKAAAGGDDDPEKLKANSSSTKPKIGNGEYTPSHFQRRLVH